eukprot:gene18079-23727_t
MILTPFNRFLTWDLKKTLLGLRGPEWSQILVDELQLNGLITPEEVVKQWEYNLNNLSSQVEAMPGAYELVDKLYSLKVPLAIATSSNNQMFIKKRMKHNEMFRKVNVVVCGDDEQVKKGKPHPDIYLIAASRLGLNPESCLAFEDALSGVESATRAGLICIAVPDKQLDKNKFLSFTSYIYDSLSDFNINDWILSSDS